MNTPNNKRKKESIERIEKVFISLLQTNELNEISVSDICKLAGLNRTTFYANYTDIYGLAIEYHMEFFKSGITKIIKLWLQNGCKESPEDMYEIIKSEYQGRADSGKECSDTL